MTDMNELAKELLAIELNLNVPDGYCYKCGSTMQKVHKGD